MESETNTKPDHAIELSDEDDTPSKAATPAKTEESRDERLQRLRDALANKAEVNAPETEEDDEDEEPETEDSDETPDAEPAEKPKTTKADTDSIDYVDGASMPKEVWKALPKDARPAFRALRDAVIRERHEKAVLETQLATEKGHAAYGRELSTFTQLHKITPEGMQEVLGAAALINAGDPAAIDWLLTYAKKLGYQEPTPAKGAPSRLERLRDEGAITEEDYRELVKDLPPTTSPARSRSQTPVTAPLQAVAPSPDAEIQAAKAALAAKDQEMAKKYGSDWSKVLREKVNKEMSRFAGAAPAQWAKIMDQSVRVVVSELRAKKRTPPAADPGLTNSAPVKRPDASKLEGRDRVRALARRGSL